MRSVRAWCLDAASKGVVIVVIARALQPRVNFVAQLMLCLERTLRLRSRHDALMVLARADNALRHRLEELLRSVKDRLATLPRSARWAAAGACVAPENNPALRFGAVLGAAAKNGHDKCTLLIPDEIAAFSSWLEQLIAESTGKHGVGILPVAGEDLGPPEVYGDDPFLDALHDDCAAGDMRACDDLYWSSPIGSEYEAFGDTCGDTVMSGQFGRCEEESG